MAKIRSGQIRQDWNRSTHVEVSQMAGARRGCARATSERWSERASERERERAHAATQPHNTPEIGPKEAAVAHRGHVQLGCRTSTSESSLCARQYRALYAPLAPYEAALRHPLAWQKLEWILGPQGMLVRTQECDRTNIRADTYHMYRYHMPGTTPYHMSGTTPYDMSRTHVADPDSLTQPLTHKIICTHMMSRRGHATLARLYADIMSRTQTV